LEAAPPIGLIEIATSAAKTKRDGVRKRCLSTMCPPVVWPAVDAWKVPARALVISSSC
jgi:hypothetical protein